MFNDWFSNRQSFVLLVSGTVTAALHGFMNLCEYYWLQMKNILNHSNPIYFSYCDRMVGWNNIGDMLAQNYIYKAL